MKKVVPISRTELNAQCDCIQEIIKKYHRWHLKKRKSNASRIWRYIFKQLDECTSKKSFHQSISLFEIILVDYTYKVTCQIQTHKQHGTIFHTITLSNHYDPDEIFAKLQEVLSHYNLRLMEKSNSYSSFNKRHFEIVFSASENTV